MTSTLCPHLFRAYVAKASDIIEIYQPQIVSVVQYDDISDGLLHRKVLKKLEHKILLKCPSDSERMIKLLGILKNRMWGLENLITIILEKNVDNWLADTLFQAYVRHLVSNMKKIQNKRLCDCVLTGNLSLVKCSWFVVFEKLDNWLLEMGNSLGYLGAPLHPVKSLLHFIRDRLNLKSRTEAMKSLLEVQCSSDSESEDEVRPLPKFGAKQTSVGVGTNPMRERSMSTPFLGPMNSLGTHAGSRRQEVLENDLPLNYEDVHKYGRSCPDIQELEWDEQADPEYYSTFAEDTAYILKLIEGNGYASSLSSSQSSSSSYFETGEMASQTNISYIPVPKASISTQTSPPSTPIVEKRSMPQKPARTKEQQQKTPPKPIISNAKPNAKGALTVDPNLNSKVASVRPSPRRRMVEVHKVKKSSPLPVPSQQQVYEDRLKPEDYGKWSNNHLSKSWRNESNNGTNVA